MASVTYDPAGVGMRNYARLTVDAVRAKGPNWFRAWPGCGRLTFRQITEAIGGWE
jgi:hypothetical protein